MKKSLKMTLAAVLAATAWALVPPCGRRRRGQVDAWN